MRKKLRSTCFERSFMHIVGFEPTMFQNEKRIMSPLLSTPQPYMLATTSRAVVVKNLIQITELFQIVFSSIQGKFALKEL